jgi:uncharacterized delta-60 repeat protein
VLLTCASAAVASSGRLDPSWGRGGVVRTFLFQGADGSPSAFPAVLLEVQGALVAAGGSQPIAFAPPAVVRYLPDGRLDRRFGRGGAVRALAATPTSGLALPDGRIVLAGAAGNGVVVERLLRSGAPDPTFGHDGTVTVDADECGGADPPAMLRQRQGLVVLFTTCSPSDLGFEPGLLRLRSDGRLDPTFGRNGIVRAHVRLDGLLAANLASQPDGKLLVSAFTNGLRGGAVIRYDRDGHLDRSFGWNGRILLHDREDPFAGLYALPDGKILLFSCRGGSVLRRFLPSGALDPSFGRAGLVRLDVPGGCLHATTAEGSRFVGITNRAVVRLSPDGWLDASFGAHGVIRVPSYSSLLVQRDGRIVTATGAHIGRGKWGYEVRRYLP